MKSDPWTLGDWLINYDDGAINAEGFQETFSFLYKI